MDVPASLLDACVRFVSEVSAEVVDDALSAVRTGSIDSLKRRLQADAAQRFDELQRVWMREASGLTHRDVAHVLYGAAHAVRCERTTRHVELVWSGPTTVDSTFRSTGPALLDLIQSAADSIYLVAFAAYKVPEVATSIQAALVRGVRVVLVLESTDASGGKVSFDPLPNLLRGAEAGLETYCWPLHARRRDARGNHGSLHAKFAVADRRRLLVSSANLTEHAFDLNIELGVLLTGGAAPAEAAEHIDELIRLGVLQPHRPAAASLGGTRRAE